MCEQMCIGYMDTQPSHSSSSVPRSKNVDENETTCRNCILQFVGDVGVGYIDTFFIVVVVVVVVARQFIVVYNRARWTPAATSTAVWKEAANGILPA